jgi:TRAP-type C4-dicarboxylate transport system substrate-binding protein
MKKFGIVFLVVALLGVLSLEVSAFTLKIATAAPEGSHWMKEMRTGAEEISLRSEGRVRIKFFAGGVMGNDKSVLRKVRIGQLHGGAFIVGSLEERVPSINILSLPLIFRSYEEVDYVRRQMDAVLMDDLEQAGFACFGFAEGGFAHIMSPSPIRSIEDARGLKIWVPEGDPISYRAMASLGLAPVTLPITDVMTGLQARLVEVVASSPIGALAFQWHTRIKYVNTTPLSYLYGTLVIDKRFFKKLTPADQEMVREVMGRIYFELNIANRQDNIQAIKAMKEQGVEFLDSSAEEAARWRKVAADNNRQLGEEGVFSVPRYQQIVDLLQEFRSGNVARKGN